ncbi:MAG: RidA family protein [Candidatus Acidiferrales bacterium]
MAATKKRKSKSARRPTKSGANGRSSHRLEYFSTPKPIPLPFSDAVRVGNLIYVSGQLGTDENLKLAPGGVLAETHRALENISVILKRSGSSLDHVVKCTVMLADMSEWDAMNTVYGTFFPKNRMPARSAFAGTGLALDARIEIECVAAVK